MLFCRGGGEVVIDEFINWQHLICMCTMLCRQQNTQCWRHSKGSALSVEISFLWFPLFLADCITVALVLHCCVCLSSVTLCIVAKRCILEQKLLLTAYKKTYIRNWLVPKWMNACSTETTVDYCNVQELCFSFFSFFILCNLRFIFVRSCICHLFL